MKKQNRQLSDFSEDGTHAPSATQPGYFSNSADVLVPRGHRDTETDSIEMDMADLIKDGETPPTTPEEMDPGRAGCRIFRDVKHYVAPCYKDDNFQRLFTVKLIIWNLFSYIPSTCVMIGLMASTHIDYLILHGAKRIVIILSLTVIATFVFVYFVGVFRNPPVLYIALAIRVMLNTSLFTSAMLLFHACFLQIIAHPSNEEEHNETAVSLKGQEEDFNLNHSPPYMGFLVICLIVSVQSIIAFLLSKYKYSVNDYRVPFVIYTSCFFMNAFLTTIILNYGFKNEPLGYDLFQVIAGCNIATMILMRTPTFMVRLFEGKVCPLKEGEIVYALLHYGL